MTDLPNDGHEAIPGLVIADDPNAWIHERRQEFLSDGRWHTPDLIQLAFMIDNAGKLLQPLTIRNQLDPTLKDTTKRALFSGFKTRLAIHKELGPYLGERDHGPQRRYWLGELVVIEDVDPNHEAVVQIAETEAAAINPAEIVPRLSQSEVERLVENLILGEALGEDIFQVIPKSYFEDQGKAINDGLRAALNSNRYPGNPIAANNFSRIKAILNRHPWETKNRI